MKALVGLLIVAAVAASCSSGADQIGPTQTALAEQQQQIVLTQTALAQERIVETPTVTPSPPPEFSPEELLALEPVQANADWSPVARESNGVTMMLVPAGCFTMSDGQNAHEQCIDEPFWIDRTEVSNQEFARFVASGGYENAAYWTDAGWNWRENNRATQPGMQRDVRFNAPLQPVVGVNWYEAYAYAQWRGCQLPTEAQWEFAARGPDNLDYPWGNTFVGANLIYRPNAGGRTAAVGGREAGASWVGAQDMAGNAWEWTSSIFASYPYNADDGRETIEGSARRVYRGGSWDSNDRAARTVFRNVHNPNVRASDIGFRVACPVPLPS